MPAIGTSVCRIKPDVVIISSAPERSCECIDGSDPN
jgi:hypothetical protein